MQIFSLFNARVEVHEIPHVVFQTKSGFFINVWIFFHCHERQLFGTLLAETIYAIKKSAHFQTCHSSHQNLPNSSCHFWNQEPVFLQTLHHSSLS